MNQGQEKKSQMTSVLISSRGSFVLLFSIRPSVLALFLGSVDDVVFFFSYKDALAIFLSRTMESKKERERREGEKKPQKGRMQDRRAEQERE